MPRISSKNQVTIPVAALDEAGLRAGDPVTIDAASPGEVRIRRSGLTFNDAFGILAGTYPPGYMEQLDADEARR